MFKDLPAGTKITIFCATFIIAIGATSVNGQSTPNMRVFPG
jgi:hypothetical protein